MAGILSIAGLTAAGAVGGGIYGYATGTGWDATSKFRDFAAGALAGGAIVGGTAAIGRVAGGMMSAGYWTGEARRYAADAGITGLAKANMITRMGVAGFREGKISHGLLGLPVAAGMKVGSIASRAVGNTGMSNLKAGLAYARDIDRTQRKYFDITPLSGRARLYGRALTKTGPLGGAGRIGNAMGAMAAGLGVMARHPAATLTVGGLGAAGIYAASLDDVPGDRSFDISDRQMVPLQSRSRFQNSATGLSFGLHARRHR